MPGTERRINPGVMHRLRDAPYRFEFFQAVRLLTGWHRNDAAEQDQDVLGQVIRFRSSISLAFPPSEIEALVFETNAVQADDSVVENGNRAVPVTLTPSFIGLTGPLGVMPRHYTQQVAEREIYHRDTATRAFLDIFSTRAIAMFYQSWLKYRLHLQYECDRENRFLPMILSLAGLGLSGTRERLRDDAGIADESLAYYASALRERPQSAQWISRVIADYFQLACRMDQFVGQWFRLPERELTRVGIANCELGQTSLCGSRVWDRQTKVRLTLGPMRKQRFDEFLPGGRGAESLKQLFRLMAGPTTDCEVRLVLDKRDLVPAMLGGASGTQLGWKSWIGTSARKADSTDVVYLIEAAVQ
jgi:type VI secretion system protein ImpH